MSEPIPESIPTSSDRRSHRATKKLRSGGPPSNKATSQQSSQIEALFATPDREIILPAAPSSTTTSKSQIAAPPEIVANVQGSSAGAGSGEFHVYKASRRREYERLRVMEEANEVEEKEREWRERQEERRKADEEKLGKNQKRRARVKARKEGRKVDGMEVDGGGKETNVKRKLVPPKLGGDGRREGVKGDVDGDVDVDGGEGGRVEEVDGGGGITFHDDD